MNVGKFLPEVLKHNLKLLYNRTYKEINRLSRLPRYHYVESNILGEKLTASDACSLLAGYKEIFINQHYKFNTLNKEPLIIDCGANIGLSTIFFKKLYPQSTIIAFEPDPAIFACLQNNIRHFKLDKIKLYQKAIWKSEGKVTFQTEGGFSGRIENADVTKKLIEIDTVRLYDYLDQKIDFLKIDIEGAETEVLQDCATRLGNVEQLFVEYHSRNNESQTLHEILFILKNAGFRYHIKEAYTASKPFVERPLMVEMDLQLDIFAFRN
jgi:FkbM family methyltransferase